MPASFAFDILKRCTNLQEGSFHTSSAGISNDGSTDFTIVQDKLRSLTILAKLGDMSFFPKIDYPSLEQLQTTDNPFPTFYQFRHIRHLTFVDFEIDANKFITATLFLPKIETLVLRFRRGFELRLLQRFFNALTDVTQETNYLPNLKSLVLQRCMNFPVLEFGRMVSRRARVRSGDVERVTMLNSVSLHFKHHCNASETLARLVDNRAFRGISFLLEVDSERYCRPVWETGVL